MKVCLVTVAIGDKYIKQYNDLFRASQETYAKKHGYDFRVVTDYISKEKHPHLVSLNKILVCSCDWSADYDIIIFVDADIVINSAAPPIHSAYDFKDKIGVVNQSQPSLEARLLSQIHKGYEVTAKEYYKLKSGHNIETDHIINTGVLVFQPKIHKEFLEKIFDNYWKHQINNKNGFHYEQSVIGYEIQSNKMHIFMDIKWNGLWANQKYFFNTMMGKNICLQEFCNANYFIHLAGQCDYDKVPALKL